MGCAGSKPKNTGKVSKQQRNRCRIRNIVEDYDEYIASSTRSMRVGSDESLRREDPHATELESLDRDLKIHETRLQLKRLIANQCEDPSEIYRLDPELRRRSFFLTEISGPSTRSDRSDVRSQRPTGLPASYEEHESLDTWKDYCRAIDLIEDLSLKKLQILIKRIKNCIHGGRPACKYIFGTSKRARFPPHRASSLRARVDRWFGDWQAGAGADLAGHVDWAVMDWDDWRALNEEQGRRRR